MQIKKVQWYPLYFSIFNINQTFLLINFFNKTNQYGMDHGKQK